MILNKKKKNGPQVNKKEKKSEEEKNKEIMDAINEVLENDDTSEENKKKLSTLLISTAFLENSLGYNDDSYNRDYTSGQWSIDEDFLNDILTKSGYAVDERGNKTDQLRNNNYNKFLQRAGYNPGDPKSMEKFVEDLKNDNALTGAYMARLKYSLDPNPLPDVSKEDIWQTWYLGYNGKGVGDEGDEDYDDLLENFNEFYDDFFDHNVPSETGDSDPQGMAPTFVDKGTDIFSPGSLI
jgi:enamine deaminase RidA (YjgF/YER057c/UK114 family)